jgi:hypothetical protein
MQTKSERVSAIPFWKLAIVLLVAAGAIWAVVSHSRPSPQRKHLIYQPRKTMDIGGFFEVVASVTPWDPAATLDEVASAWRGAAGRKIESLDQDLADPSINETERLTTLLIKSNLLNSEGRPREAYAVLDEARSYAAAHDALAPDWLYSVIYMQGVAALRRGENENCILCRGESSCILPISPAAVHTNPDGSQVAIGHFTEYLEKFPDDLGARWLLNLAHMTLGEHPHKVDPRFLVSLDHFRQSEFDIGRFRDVGAVVGVNRFNQAGGAIMDDFDNDGLLDLITTAIDPTQPMAIFRNAGDGRFVECSGAAGVLSQLGGLYCVQTDFNNDGFADVYVPRGAWIRWPIRPTLLENMGDGTFLDVTGPAGLLDPVNSNSATWADYDNDGLVDLFVCCETQPVRLFQNLGDGRFLERAASAGLAGEQVSICKGAAWIDFDNDGYPDLFIDSLNATSRLYQNRRNGTFADVTSSMGIDGPFMGFSCWAWDYDNDGWLDIFATCYERTLDEIVKGLVGQPHAQHSNRLYRNMEGHGFEDRTKEAGLDMVFATMGSNFADFDNDGFLDMYLATGDPSIDTLVPNRMFKNIFGRRFAEITAGSGTGHLQKGHAVACGDWDRDGDVDLFVELGGVVNGDRFHNVLFQNPGQANRWLMLKLSGRESNRAAIGARIKLVTAGEQPLTIHRHITSGSSFGANPLAQTIGLAGGERIARLEITWPASQTTQVFRDIDVNQSIEITEFDDGYRRLPQEPIPLPE